MAETNKNASPETVSGDAAENQQPANETNQATGEVMPEWAKALTASNEAVIASNEALKESNEALVAAIQASNDGVVEVSKEVVEAVKNFNDKASDVVKEILETANKMADGSQQAAPAPKAPKVDPDARYVVKEGKQFVDKNDTSVTYKGGHDVTHLENDRLQNLLSQGTIEAVTDDED